MQFLFNLFFFFPLVTSGKRQRRMALVMKFISQGKQLKSSPADSPLVQGFEKEKVGGESNSCKNTYKNVVSKINFHRRVEGFFCVHIGACIMLVKHEK